MSFPGSYNIRYYYGDTLEFRIFPKNASGEIFDLSTFTDVKFTLAENRNAPVSEHITCFAQISSDNTNILCTIRPEDSENINPELQYVYDVEVSKTATPYDIVYTLLTGSVTVVRDVTRPDDGPPPVQVPIPEAPENLTLVNATTSSLEVSWDSPPEGVAPDFYRVTILPFTSDEQELLQAIQESTAVIPSSQTDFVFSDLSDNTEYSVIIVATNIEDVFDEEALLTNDQAFSTVEIIVPPEFPNNPEDLTFSSSTTTTLTVGWQPPSEGIEPSAYKLTILPFTTDQETIENSITASTNIVSGTTFSRTFSGLTQDTQYTVAIVSLDSEGSFNLENYLTNAEPFTTAAEEAPPPVTPDFFITNDGAGAYLIDGVSNDTITLVRGQTYTFELDASGHPFWIQSVPAPYDAGEVYGEGIDGNGTAVGIITWTVDASAPSTLYYVCQFHSAMTGTILIIDDDDEEYDEYDNNENLISVPSAPVINSINEFDESLEVVITVPEDGGSPITNYKYSVDGSSYTAFDPEQTRPTAVTLSVTVENVDGSNKYFIDGVDRPDLVLYRGVTYTFDQSDPSNETHQIHLSETEDGTHNGGSEYTSGVTYTGTAGTDGQLVFEVPEDAPNLLYYVCVNHSGMAIPAKIFVQDFSLIISGLTNGITYPVTIKAVNSAGDSDASNSVTATPTEPITTIEPAAPTINSITPGDESLVVNFTAANAGSGPITNYKYSIDGTNYIALDPATTTSPLTITGLTNGTPYSVTIKAVNEFGDSESSNSVTATPAAPEPELEPAQTFEVTSSGTSAYIIDGQSNPTLTLVRGESYEFNINASGHPFFIQTVAGAYSSGNVYNEGITGNGTQVGTLTWEVSLSAPDTLYYVCQFHSSMQGTINIIDGDS